MSDHLDIRVTSFDLDQGALKPYRCFEWAQQVHEALSPPMTTGPEITWVYGRHRARWHVPDVVARTVRPQTWLADISGAFATREFRMHDAESGQMLFERQTVAVALDTPTLRATVSDLSYLKSLVSGPKGSIELTPFASEQAIERFRFERVVEADDLDRQAHVNNASYVRWATDVLARHAWESKPGTMAAHRLGEFEIRYQFPLKMRDTVVLTGRCVSDEAWLIDMSLPDGRAVATVSLRVHETVRRKC
jgi:acyl-CoA thioesterase FadM